MRIALVVALVSLGVVAAGPGLATDPAPPPRNGTPEAAGSREALQASIASVEREIATRRMVLKDGSAGDAELAALRQLLDILQRSDGALRVAGQLSESRAESAHRSALDPQASFRRPPPFSVPILDAVYLSWDAQRRQAERLEQVVEHRRAEHEAALEKVDEAERARRLARDELERAKDDAARSERSRRLRERELVSRIAQASASLAEIELANARIEQEVQRAAETQARAVLDFVRRRLEPDDADLEDVLADLDKRSFDVERALETTRLDLAAAASRLDDAQQRADAAQGADVAVRAEELAARRLQFTAAQRRVVLLGERMQRLALAREAWQRRYHVLAGTLRAEEVRSWRGEARDHVGDLERQRRIREARRAELEGELETLRERALAVVTEASAEGADDAARERAAGLQTWLGAQEKDLERLVGLYREDLASLGEVITLQRRLEHELDVHAQGLAVRERLVHLRDVLREWWRYELTSSEDRPITVGKVTTALLIFVFGWWVARFLSRLIGGQIFRRIGLDPGVASAFEALLQYAALAVAFVVALRLVNIPLTAFAVLGGALALGVGFGSQAVVSNFISGLILLAERPIKLGDHVEVEGVYGIVDRIGLRSTRIRTGDNYHLIIPNASLLERSVINWTHENRVVRLRIAVGVAYGSPTREVEAILRSIVCEHPRTIDSPEPVVLFMEFADSSLLFEVRFWITVRDLLDRLGIESDVRHTIDERLRAAGITIAFPQRDVHLDGIGPIDVRLRAPDAGDEGGAEEAQR